MTSATVAVPVAYPPVRTRIGTSIRPLSMRSKTPAIAAITLILVAVAVVFSPLVAALTGTGLNATALAAASDGLATPVGRSVGMAAVAAVVALALGVPFALVVDRCRPGVRRVCWAVGLLALVVPPYVVAEAWIVLLGPAGKVARPVAMALGFGPHLTAAVDRARYTVPGFVYSWSAAGGVMGGCLFPIVALAVAGVWRRTDRRAFESARLCQGRRGVAAVVARVVVPPAAGAALLVSAVTMTEFAVPELLRFRSVGQAVYEQVQQGELAAAAAVCLPVLPFVLAAGVAGVAVLGRARAASLAGLEGEVPTFTGGTAGVGGHVAAGVATLTAAAPAVGLTAVSLTWLAVTAARPVGAAGGTHRVLRASGFAESLAGAWDLARDDAVRTVTLAAVAATVAVAFAVALARLAPRVRGGPAALGALGAGLAVPAPIVGLGLIVLWNRGGVAGVVYGGPAVVLLAWLARFLPVVVFVVRSAVSRVPRELEEAAALAGRGPAERLVGVVLRGAAPGLLAAWLAMYVLSAAESNATVLVSPAGRPMLAPSVVNLMRRGQDPEVAACQVLLLAAVGLPAAVVAGAAAAVAQLKSRRPRQSGPINKVKKEVSATDEHG